ncbi:RNA polymerase sigma factor [Tenggerimyces flavus]|uniref:RNA polymerase sigma factor n=1 Tax=Tenggerimyces flavus TaxID=1708749 RepID=A0ABV7YLX2_9ACTN|nr:sigma factor-like helix-turn-helix DNA-binding protein [Tenggerimyces flavus]MBM7790017.1 DNA-directed RNA polymerase specialized sigma24 family protein [Tenggerimyces flavus]
MHEIGKLPGSQRDVLALCVWDGLSYAEAAIALAVPVGTVRSRLARARARLAEVDHQESAQRPGALRASTEEMRG